MWYELCIVFWRRETKKKKKFNVPLWFEFPVRLFFSFSLVHWIFCSALWNHKLVLIILPDCVLYFDFKIFFQLQRVYHTKIAQILQWFMVNKRPNACERVCVCVCVFGVGHKSLLTGKRPCLSPKGPFGSHREGGLGEWGDGEGGGGGGGEREESFMLAWGPDQPPASLNTIDRHSDISQHMPSILSLPSLTCPPVQQREH